MKDNFEKICSISEYFDEENPGEFAFYSDIEYFIVDGDEYPIKILYFIENSRNGQGLVFGDDAGYVNMIYSDEVEKYFSKDSYIAKFSEDHSEYRLVKKEFSNGWSLDEEKVIKEIIKLRKQLKERS